MMAALSPLVVTATLFLAWMFTPLGSIPMTFVKIDTVKTPYAVIFFGLLLVCLFFLRLKIDRMSWIRTLLIAVVAGHLLSIISFTVAELIMPAGIERFGNSLRVAGFLQFVAVQLLFPGVLIGWIIAPLAVAALKLSKKILPESTQ